MCATLRLDAEAEQVGSEEGPACQMWGLENLLKGPEKVVRRVAGVSAVTPQPYSICWLTPQMVTTASAGPG